MTDRPNYPDESLRCPRKPTIYCVSPGPTERGGCCEVIPAGEPVNFSVGYRNPGHWDISTWYGRAFRIRGEPGEVSVHDERVDDMRPFPRDRLYFETVSQALTWCAAQLMAEEGHP